MIYKLNIEVIQLLNDRKVIEQCIKFAHMNRTVEEVQENNGMVIVTDEGVKRVQFGDWFMRCNNRFYSCKQGYFDKVFKFEKE